MASSEIGQTFSMLLVLAIMGFGLAFMIGGPKLAEKYFAWFRKKLFLLISWAIKLPFRILGRLIFGKKQKKKKKKKRP